MFHVKEKAGGREGERRRNNKEKEKIKTQMNYLKKQKNKFEPSFTTLRILKRITGELI